MPSKVNEVVLALKGLRSQMALLRRLEMQGLSGFLVERPDVFSQGIDEERTAVVVVDADFPEGGLLPLLRDEVLGGTGAVPVIAVLSKPSPHLEIELLSAGAYDVIVQPVDVETMAEKIAQAVACHRAALEAMNLRRGIRKRLDMDLPSECNMVHRVVCHVVREARDFGFRSSHLRTAIPLALTEALVNAVKHGNDEAADKRVGLVVEIDVDGLQMTVWDEGAGFDPESIPRSIRPEDILKESGRGIFLIRAYMDEVEFSDGGRRIRMKKYARDEISSAETRSPEERVAER